MSEVENQEYQRVLKQSHLVVLQGIVSRMANNCKNCKTWCVAIVTAMLVALVEKNATSFVLLTTVPVTLFLFLDAYYLGLERAFRKQYDDFILKSFSSEVEADDMLLGNSNSRLVSSTVQTAKSFFSFSVAPFYLILFGMIITIHHFL